MPPDVGLQAQWRHSG